ncbi:MAG: hypothetical protein RR844_01335 [Clostridium sp.]
MALEMFNFIDSTLICLEEIREDLTKISIEIEDYFNSIVSKNCEGYINISSRVKGSNSLKEKIIRNNYYKKDCIPNELLYSLSDLIGVRLECRFIKDEEEIYNILKNHFNIKDEDGYSFNSKNKRIFIEISSPQPQYQKNGFSIFRIDGRYIDEERIIPFELQIKSLVNIFWGEIEHKIIYKNNSYLLIDSYIKDMMSSIKKNLMMIDHQLLVTYNQFNTKEITGLEGREDQFQKLLSKIIHDAYSAKLNNSLGFIVDFKKPCDTIMKYFLRDGDKNFANNMIKILSRLNEISALETKFDEEISFEREPVFKDLFTEKIGEKLLTAINTEFHWNLFFRIMFEIEPLNNVEDFETFIGFIKEGFTSNPSFTLLENKYGTELSNEIQEELLLVIADSFVKIDSIEFIVDNALLKINTILSKVILKIVENIKNKDDWEKEKDIILETITIQLLAIFDLSIPTEKVKEFIESICSKGSIYKVSPFNLQYLNNLSIHKKIKAKELLKLLNL